VNDAIPFLRVVCAAIQHPEKPDHFLVAQRPLGDRHLAGLWEFPGGKIESDESENDALIREIREELAIAIVVKSPLTPVVWTYPHIRIELIPFVCETPQQTCASHAHHCVQWIPIDRFDSLDWAPADIPIYQELQARVSRPRA
jgi:8-oxo-dGTP diphosphatase